MSLACPISIGADLPVRVTVPGTCFDMTAVTVPHCSTKVELL